MNMHYISSTDLVSMIKAITDHCPFVGEPLFDALAKLEALACSAPIAPTQPDGHESGDMNPNDIDLTQAIRIGFASSIAEGRPRWTEIAVWFLTDPQMWRRPWLAEVIGRSSVPGERDKRQVLSAGSLERAIKLFDDSDLARFVVIQAQQWRDENPHRVRRIPEGETKSTVLARQLLQEEAERSGAGETDWGRGALPLDDNGDCGVALRAFAAYIDEQASRDGRAA